MKFTTLLSAVIPVASAWELQITGTDGRQGWMAGVNPTLNCIDLIYSPPVNVKYSSFQPQGTKVSRYQFWTNKGCTGLYVNLGSGTHQFVNPTVWLSYKVY